MDRAVVNTLQSPIQRCQLCRLQGSCYCKEASGNLTAVNCAFLFSFTHTYQLPDFPELSRYLKLPIFFTEILGKNGPLLPRRGHSQESVVADIHLCFAVIFLISLSLNTNKVNFVLFLDQLPKVPGKSPKSGSRSKYLYQGGW